MPGPFATAGARSANPASTSPQRIPSRQRERLPLQVQGRRAPGARREGTPCGSCLVSSFPPLPSPNRRLVLRLTPDPPAPFGTVIEAHWQCFVARTYGFLLVTQGHYGIDTRRAARWDVARHERNTAKHKAHGSERQGVGGLYAEEQSCQKPSQADRSNNSDTKTDECHSQSVPHN